MKIGKKSKRISEKKYKEDFGITSVDTRDARKLRLALNHALDIRKFEIELYWKRASYFWTLIAAAFAGYFAILSAQNLDKKEFLAFIVACVGFMFTFAWLQVNRGSKQWQENWENHVDMLEDKSMGPLYKTILCRPKEKDFLERYVTGPSNISVSKTNQIVSLFTLCIWLILAVPTVEHFDYIIYIVAATIIPLFFSNIYRKIIKNQKTPKAKTTKIFILLTLLTWLASLVLIPKEHLQYMYYVVVGAITSMFCILIVWKGKTHLGDHKHVVRQRTTWIDDPKSGDVSPPKHQENS